MFGSEGFWLFQGPRDFSDNYTYGSVFACTKEVPWMPSATVRYHNLHPPASAQNTVLIAARRAAEDDSAGGAPTAFLFPDEHFFNVIQELGFIPPSSPPLRIRNRVFSQHVASDLQKSAKY